MSNSSSSIWTAESILVWLRSHREELRALGVTQIGLFGSYARGQQSPNSDVDLLFTMEPLTWAGWMDVWNFLEDQLHLTVDLVPAKDLRDEVRPTVLREVRYVEE